jgi:uncharacterized protein (TIGR02569 family)
MPRRSSLGAFVVDGWMASTFCEGSHEQARWLDVIEVADRLHGALAHVARPPFHRGRDDPWAKADRVAWGEASVTPFLHVPHVARLAPLLAPIDDPSQVIHGDLTGNVLFADPLPPAVIDLAVYWRPAVYAHAVVVADALAWEGATPDDLAPATSRGGFGVPGPCPPRPHRHRLARRSALGRGSRLRLRLGGRPRGPSHRVGSRS